MRNWMKSLQEQNNHGIKVDSTEGEQWMKKYIDLQPHFPESNIVQWLEFDSAYTEAYNKVVNQ